jgi:hypothetical protein
MNDFERNVKAIKAGRDAPVTTTHEALAPTRAALVQGRKDFLELAGSLGAIFEAARIQEQQAAAVGVTHSTLTHALREVYGNGTAPGLLAGGPTAYDGALYRCAAITTPDLDRDPHLLTRLRATPGNIGACAGALKDMARRVQFACRELEEMVRQAAGMPSPAPVMTAPSWPPLAEVHVES